MLSCDEKGKIQVLTAPTHDYKRRSTLYRGTLVGAAHGCIVTGGRPARMRCLSPSGSTGFRKGFRQARSNSTFTGSRRPLENNIGTLRAFAAASGLVQSSPGLTTGRHSGE